MKSNLLKFHFLILLILVINFIIAIGFDFGLNHYITISLKILLYGSAIVGAFLFFNPFKFITAYFSLYVISPFLIFVAWLADGIFGAILASVFVGIFHVSTPIYTQNDYEIHEEFRGFMGHCCGYEVYKNHFIFSQKIGKVSFDDFLHSDKVTKLEIQEDMLILHFEDNSTETALIFP